MELRPRQVGGRKGVRAWKFRAGLQVKSALVLSLVIAVLMVGGASLFFRVTQESLVASDRLYAAHLAAALSLSACDDLRRHNVAPLQRLAGELIHNDSVRDVALLDANGKVVASAGQGGFSGQWRNVESLPVCVADTCEAGQDVLTLARPVLTAGPNQRVVGAVRLLVDTAPTRVALEKVRMSLLVIAAAVIGAWLLVGNWLVWRVVIRPVRRLVVATRQLGQGDSTVRSRVRAYDEILDLAVAFDTMASQVARRRPNWCGPTRNWRTRSRIARANWRRRTFACARRWRRRRTSCGPSATTWERRCGISRAWR